MEKPLKFSLLRHQRFIFHWCECFNIRGWYKRCRREKNNGPTCYTLDATPSSVLLTLEIIKKLYWSLWYIQKSCLAICSNMYLFTSFQMVDGGWNDAKHNNARPNTAPWRSSEVTACQLIVFFFSPIIWIFYHIIGLSACETRQFNTLCCNKRFSVLNWSSSV